MNFALSEEAVRLAKSTGIDEKIADLEKQDLLSQAAMPISNNSELLSWVNDLKKEGFYSQDDRYVEKLLWIIVPWLQFTFSPLLLASAYR